MDYPHRDRISLVIPVLNEEEGLEELIAKACPYAGEILVIDGHSTDRSAEIAAACGARVHYDHRKGKGDALRTAVPLVTGEVTVFMDADWSHDPDDIPRLVRPILDGEADHVTGSRLLGGSSELHGGFDEFLRLMGSSFITACIGRRFRVRISDSQNGFRAIRTEVLRKLDLRENITTIEQEMIIKTLKAGYRLAEVPAHENKRRYKTSHIRVGRVWLRYGYSLLKYLYFWSSPFGKGKKNFTPL
jgi:glycosyltransferase involved in cell wall biosynthesis